MLARLARTHGVALRQSFVRVAKRAALMAERYAHAKQFKRTGRELRFLRTRLGRLIRDIRRKTADDEALREAFAIPLSRADQVRREKQRQRGWKLYSLHAPEVECIGKPETSGGRFGGADRAEHHAEVIGKGGRYLAAVTLPSDPTARLFAYSASSGAQRAPSATEGRDSRLRLKSCPYR